MRRTTSRALQQELATALAGIEHEIILVDDCSSDQTLARIERTPEVRVLEFEKNTGTERGHVCRHPRGARRGHRAARWRPAKRSRRHPAPARGDRPWRRPRLRLPRQSQGHLFQAPHEPLRECGAQPLHARWRARHRLHAQGDARANAARRSCPSTACTASSRRL